MIGFLKLISFSWEIFSVHETFVLASPYFLLQTNMPLLPVAKHLLIPPVGSHSSTKDSFPNLITIFTF